jgi:hypothetical protein
MEVGKAQPDIRMSRSPGGILLRRRQSGPSETFMQLVERGGLAVDKIERAASDVCSRERAPRAGSGDWQSERRRRREGCGNARLVETRRIGRRRTLAALAGMGGRARGRSDGGGMAAAWRGDRSRSKDHAVETSRHWSSQGDGWEGERRRGVGSRMANPLQPQHIIPCSIYNSIAGMAHIVFFRSQGGPSAVQCNGQHKVDRRSLGSVSLAGEKQQRGGGEAVIKVQGRTMGVIARLINQLWR